MSPELYDAVIAGGGPAGISAALVLGRYLRRVLVCDAGNPRNASSRAMHGFIGHDGIGPAEPLQKARRELKAYNSVEWRAAEVTAAEKNGREFTMVLKDGGTVSARALLLATGVKDRLPEVAGAGRFYGVSLHHCPYCDAFEHRGQRLGVLGNDRAAADMARELRLWSSDATLFTNSDAPLSGGLRGDMEKARIRVVTGKAASLDGGGKTLQWVRLRDGSSYSCGALFFTSRETHRSSLAAALGCGVDFTDGAVACGGDGNTGVEGVFVAGNISGGRADGGGGRRGGSEIRGRA